MKEASALYVGQVVHQRLRPKRHRLGYRVYSLLVDLDELPGLARRLRLFSLNRFNLFSLYERDHGAGDGTGARAYVERQLHAAGLPTGGAIRLLTMPRILGYAFNPISVYFCDDACGVLRALLYEVNSTYGERHSYLIEVDPAECGASTLHQQCGKRLHVSPFLAMDMRYEFRVAPPSAERVDFSLGISAHDTGGAVLAARFAATRRPLSDAALLRVFLSHPLLTLKVITAIHWEALRLWLKGLRPQPRPAPPPQAVTVIRHDGP